MRPDQLSGITAFVATARRHSFTAAAAELGVSPSAVSHAIRQLERRAGVRLLNRTTRSVGLTEAGEQFLAQVAPALETLTEALDSAGQQQNGPAGLLRLNLPRIASELVLERQLKAFRAAYPGIRLELVLDDQFSDIVASGCDAGIRLGESLQGDMVGVPISPELRSVVIGAPEYFRRHPPPKTPADLARHDCINFRLPARGAIYRWEFERDGRSLDVAVSGALTVNDPQVIRRLALSGLGLAYLLNDAVEADIADGRLISVLEEWCPRFPGHCLYYPRSSNQPGKLRALIDFLRQR